MTYAVIISARMSSMRLPGKPLTVYCPDGMTNIEQIARRWLASRRNPTVIIATSDKPEDDTIRHLITSKLPDVLCYQGSREDVVARMDGAIKLYANEATYIARAMADNPLVDVGLADWRLDRLEDSGADGFYIELEQIERLTYAATTDVWSRRAWDRIAAGSSGSQREHPGAWWFENQGVTDLSAIGYVLPRREYLADVRTELDTPEDLEMFKAVFGRLEVLYKAFGEPLLTMTALRYLEERPDLAALNHSVPMKTQTKPAYPKGNAWRCRECGWRAATILSGDLVVGCQNCGHKQKYYAKSPGAHTHRLP